MGKCVFIIPVTDCVDQSTQAAIRLFIYLQDSTVNEMRRAQTPQIKTHMYVRIEKHWSWIYLKKLGNYFYSDDVKLHDFSKWV